MKIPSSKSTCNTQHILIWCGSSRLLQWCICDCWPETEQQKEVIETFPANHGQLFHTSRPPLVRRSLVSRARIEKLPERERERARLKPFHLASPTQAVQYANDQNAFFEDFKEVRHGATLAHMRCWRAIPSLQGTRSINCHVLEPREIL